MAGTNAGISEYVVLALVLAVLVVLALGVVNLLRGKDAARSNRLMVWRVSLQGLALLLAALLLVR